MNDATNERGWRLVRDAQDADDHLADRLAQHVESLLDAAELLDQAKLHVPHTTTLRADIDNVLADLRAVR